MTAQSVPVTSVPARPAPWQPLPVRLVLAAIRFYQRSLSPRKGWCCAHRVHHGGYSCSEWTKRAVARRGLRTGALVARRRFARCNVAAHALRAQRLETEAERKQREGKRHGSRSSGDGWCVGGPSALCSPADASILADCACCLLDFSSYTPIFPFCL